jgi:hypothetical protein
MYGRESPAEERIDVLGVFPQGYKRSIIILGEGLGLDQ